MRENLCAVACEVVVEGNTVAGVSEKISERALAALERLLAET
jgi:hypothetical protein